MSDSVVGVDVSVDEVPSAVKGVRTKKVARNVRWREERGEYYVDFVSDGVRVCQSLKTADLKEAVRLRDAMMKAYASAKAQGKLEEFRRLAGGHRREVETVAVASVGEVFDAYEAAAGRLGEPSGNTVRDNMGALRRVLELGSLEEVRDVRKVSTSALDVELLRRYASRMLERYEDEEKGRRVVSSLIRQAKGVFSRRMLQEYEGLKLPDGLRKFLDYAPTRAGRVVREPFTPEEVEVLRRGASLKGERPELYMVWLLGYYCALRAGEMVQAKRSWIVEMPVSEDMREASVWLQSRSTFWCLDLAHDRDFAGKTPAAAGFVPLADDVAGELLATFERLGGGEFLLKGSTPTGRSELVHRVFSRWMREQGWPEAREKTSHALRAFRQEVWARRYGEGVRAMWSRHAVKGVAAHYVSRLDVSRRPLGLGE